MYNQIASNKRKTFLLFFLFAILIMGLGIAFDIAFGLNYMGVVLAFMFTIIWSLVSYFSGDKIVLRLSGAKLAKKTEHAHLINVVEGLAIAADIPVPKIYVINDNAINAFATGRNPENSSVAVTTGAIDKLNREELEGVIAHELSHIKNYDIRTMLLAAVLVGVIALLSRFMLRSFFYGRKRDRKGGSLQLIGLAIGLLAAILAPLVANLIKLAISRKREFLADASGAMLTRYPKGLANALKKIENDHSQLKTASNATAHLYISNPFKKKGLIVKLFSTHPPIEKRIQALESM
ncbi:MAG: Protease HtpX [Candidatus Woesearchaeota archaeon]|nr:Protease HtpX [Candidatus Woesearchaeota archaeon]